VDACVVRDAAGVIDAVLAIDYAMQAQTILHSESAGLLTRCPVPLFSVHSAGGCFFFVVLTGSQCFVQPPDVAE
jgi:hypothetical protein